jgi:hypothetical protein
MSSIAGVVVNNIPSDRVLAIYREVNGARKVSLRIECSDSADGLWVMGIKQDEGAEYTTALLKLQTLVAQYVPSESICIWIFSEEEYASRYSELTNAVPVSPMQSMGLFDRKTSGQFMPTGVVFVLDSERSKEDFYNLMQLINYNGYRLSDLCIIRIYGGDLQAIGVYCGGDIQSTIIEQRSDWLLEQFEGWDIRGIVGNLTWVYGDQEFVRAYVDKINWISGGNYLLEGYSPEGKIIPANSNKGQSKYTYQELVDIPQPVTIRTTISHEFIYETEEHREKHIKLLESDGWQVGGMQRIDMSHYGQADMGYQIMASFTKDKIEQHPRLYEFQELRKLEATILPYSCIERPIDNELSAWSAIINTTKKPILIGFTYKEADSFIRAVMSVKADKERFIEHVLPHMKGLTYDDVMSVSKAFLQELVSSGKLVHLEEDKYSTVADNGRSFVIRLDIKPTQE